MKNLPIKFFLVLTSLTISCKQHFEVENGRYLAKENELFYAIELNKSTNKIKIYCCGSTEEKTVAVTIGENSYTIPPSEADEIFNYSLPEKKDDGRDFEIFSEGDFSIKDNEILISNLESDILPSNRPERINAEFSENKILIDCKDLYQYMGANPIFCRSKQIEFTKE